ncbi:inosamine-phosphate amidinotransferase 1 [Streptomyces sp. CBMA123]|uniref:inosamine-phosphate amidinotransferase 1 n=1 Tax=Streptomyces sp. CBMA123 TaxID=1896313 RepID=UPI001661D29C|nr:inosamine-phosphate amidinotransferase 1 [Streptomyces sp. CBMA123]MBD0693852.1 inosamine-phosphate amidinotransferase 1 [Streptomyces sp. CBMA123]
MSSPVSAHNEWDPLEEVIVGSAVGARIPRAERSILTLDYRDGFTAETLPSGPYPADVVEKTEEELQALCDALTGLGVTVRRPSVADPEAVLRTGLWETDGYLDHAPRDVALVVGDLVIDAPMVVRGRALKQALYKDLFTEYFNRGARWISAPRPKLADETYLPELPEGQRLANLEPLFDAANVIRLGTDLLYQVSDGGNELGARWLQEAVGSEYTVHPCRNLYTSLHIDTTIVPLRPGLVLLHPERVNEDNLPPILSSWDKIWCPELNDIGFAGSFPVNSPWIGMNILSVRPDLVIADHRQPELIKLLEAKGIDVLPLSLSHARTFGGGFHCATLDVRRTGALETYR